MKVNISARAEGGFFRCGRFFPKAGIAVASGEFADAEWKRLVAEPNLLITELPDETPDDEALIGQVFAAIGELPGDAFTKAGPPKLDAVRDAVADGALITRAHVDEAWARAQDAGQSTE